MKIRSYGPIPAVARREIVPWCDKTKRRESACRRRQSHDRGSRSEDLNSNNDVDRRRADRMSAPSREIGVTRPFVFTTPATDATTRLCSMRRAALRAAVKSGRRGSNRVSASTTSRTSNFHVPSRAMGRSTRYHYTHRYAHGRDGLSRGPLNTSEACHPTVMARCVPIGISRLLLGYGGFPPSSVRY